MAKSKEYMREWHKKNPGKQAEYGRRWRERHPERNRERQIKSSKTWKFKNPVRIIMDRLALCQEAKDLIHRYEGWVARPYLDPIGLATVGYGHLILKREYQQYGVKVVNGRQTLVDPEGHKLTREEGDALFMRDLHRFLVGVSELCPVKLSDLQFGALVSFSFNVGLGNLRASTLRRRVNARDNSDVPYQFSRWNKAGGRVLRGLTLRRRAEGELYRRGT